MNKNLAGKTWAEVKNLLENETTVDSDNIDKENGDCIVDFSQEYSDFSIKGRMVKNENETVIEIADDAVIYKNN